MGKVTRAEEHLSEAQIMERIKAAKGFWRVQRWMVIRHALVDPSPAAKIAEHVGVAVQTVHNLVSQYNRFGPQAVETTGRGCRGRAYLSMEEERRFLEPFIARAEAGQFTTAAEIKAEFEELVGGPVHESTIYRLLKRHGWRKLAPRPRHTKADPVEQEEFKKTSPKR